MTQTTKLICMEPRIKPIEHPKGIFNKLMYRRLSQQFGKVLLPAKIIYARYPKMGMLVRKLHHVEESLKLTSPEEKLLIQSLVATINGCYFCIDISKRKAINNKMDMQKFMHLPEFRHGECFSKREMAILTFTEEMTRKLEVSDETYAAVHQYCTDEEIIEITYTASAENFLNRLLKPLQIGSDELCSL